jgi:PKD repeat protein
MKKKTRLKVAVVIVSLLISIINLPGSVFAMGEYDGVWLGSETINVPSYGSMTETTGTVIYQEDQNTLNFWDPMFGSVDLVRSGSQWVLPSPVSTTYIGYSATITSITLIFPSSTYLTGTINVVVEGVPGTGTLAHTKQSCQSVTNGTTLSGLSGSEDSLRCYEINLPSGATNLNVQTSGGVGDCDLIQIYHRPNFEYDTSENYGNQEQIFVPSPQSGKWYLGLTGWESYAGLNLSVSFVSPPVPVSNFTSDLVTGNVPLTVSFTDQSTGAITSWEWVFGDGTMSNNKNPIHTYSDPGSYTVTLTVTGPGGTDIETKTGYVVVKETVMPWIPLLLLKNKE